MTRLPDHTSRFSPVAALDMPAFLARRAAERGEHPFLIWAPDEGLSTTYSYARFTHEVRCIASGLAARGIGRGDRVLVHLENSPETLLARLACAWLGAVCVATNAMATGPELAVLADVAQVRAAITQPAHADMLASHVPGLDWIVVTETDAGRAPTHAPAFADSFASLYGAPMEQRPAEPDLPAMILFTTGTTGRAKAVLWTHENLVFAATLGALQQRLQQDDIVQIYLPLFHVVGYSWGVLSTLGAGATVLLQPKFSASRFWPLALEHKASVAAQVPFTIGALRKLEVPAQHGFRRWITNMQMHEDQARYGIDGFSSAWGMTEMVSQPIIGDPSIGPLMNGAMGRTSFAYDLRIADENGRSVEPGGSGELLIKGTRGRSIFLEYFGEPQQTADAFDEHGYFRAGDRVRLNEDGSITFLDRIKDVIKVGGEGVAAGEIEQAILSVAGVGEVAVVAGPDEMRGEVPVAFIVRDSDVATPNETLSAQIEAHCAGALARFKQPRRILFLDALPKVGFGKISKARLRDMAKAELMREAGE